MTQLLTASRLRAYRKCSRLESLMYEQGWRPAEEGEALLFGSLWHRGLEAWWLQHQFGFALDALNAALDAVASRASDPYAQVRCEELLRGYDAHWRDQALAVVSVEEEFRAPLINPATFQASRTWTLAGRVDVKALDGERRLVVEHKTTSEDIAPEADYWLKLAMDHQLSIYTVGAEASGWAPDACLYDVVKKPNARPYQATPIEARKYTKDGRLYANQHEADETPDEYRARVREAIEAEPAAYFQRREIPRIESQIKEFLEDAWAQGRDMHEAHKAHRAPRNPDACHQFGRCPFWEHCSTGMELAEHPERWHQIEHVHPELTADDVAA